ncbi:AI-2E family transporter [Arenibaculum sp.]|jgi:predicted PurR-regulated permease PerM|uniref:AI-2E family transporter n=1 Tax=Arenibaculum sp. TaxID=2865862 RepID=UPI002E15E368|nr:AI-2E family transporter [Arenibaculum sp.]
MTARRQLRFWLIGLVVFLAALWVLGDVLLPFVAGMAIAYFLDPVADRLERAGAARWLATTLVLVGFVLALVAALLLLAPLIQAQILELLDTLPHIAAWFRESLVPLAERVVRSLSPDDLERLRAAAGEFAGDAVGWVGRVARGVVAGGVALFDVLSLLFITPVVAFYLLRDWDEMVARIHGWLPRQHAPVILAQVAEVDRTLAGFVRGQATVCLILGLFYALALSLVGLEFGLVIGLLAGLLSFIPFVGSLFGFAGSVGIALFQYDTWVMVAVVAGIFLLGQAVEGNVLTPRLVGGKVGLHPVWVIFALLAGGSLFGFVGVLLAVPVAAVIGVLARFALGQYLASRYYTGPAPPAAGAP